MIKSKKAIVTVAVIISFLLISVVFFTTYYSFLGSQTSDFELKVSGADFNRDIEIIKVDGSDIVLKNDFANTLSITSIQINSIECLSSTEIINLGLNTIDIGNCTNSLSLMTLYSVLVISNYGIREEYEVLHSLG